MVVWIQVPLRTRMGPARPHWCWVADRGCFMAGWRAPGRTSWFSLTREDWSLARRVYYSVLLRQIFSLFLCQDHIKVRGGTIYNQESCECETCIFLQSLLCNFAKPRRGWSIFDPKNFYAGKWDPELIRETLWERKWVRSMLWWYQWPADIMGSIWWQLGKIILYIWVCQTPAAHGIGGSSPKGNSNCRRSSSRCWNAVIMTSVLVV